MRASASRAAAAAAADDVTEPVGGVLRRPAGGVGGRLGDGEDRALDGLPDRGVARLGAASAMPSANTSADRSSGPASPSRLHSAPTSWDRITPELPRAPSSAPRANAVSAVRTPAGDGAVGLVAADGVEQRVRGPPRR